LVAQTAESIVAEQLFEQTQLALAEARRLYEAGRRISASGDRESILKVVLDVVATTAAHRAAVFMFDRVDSSDGPGAQTLVSYWDRAGAEPPVLLGTRHVIGRGALSRVTSAQEPWVITTVRTQEHAEDEIEEILAQMGAQAAALVPLSAGSECLGYVAAMTRGARVLTADELRICQAVSNQAALGLQTLRLLRDAEHRARRERVIREISTKISDTVDLDSILNTTVQELGRALGVSRAFVRLTTGSETEMPEAGGGGTDAASAHATVTEEQSTAARS
jgi:GAF domain-containing protein